MLLYDLQVTCAIAETASKTYGPLEETAEMKAQQVKVQIAPD